MRARHFSRLFVGLTLIVLLSDVAFVAANYVTARQALEDSLAAEGEKLHSGYDVAMAMTFANMLQLATFIASDPEIEALVAEGARAVAAEGGGPGKARAATVRGRLLDLVDHRWQMMTREFGVRQLHFHLAPGSLSFLRVHTPHKFGDRMDDVRHIIVDVNRDGQPRTGLETGRIYTGLRGVVSLTQGGRHIGAVEVGSSFGPILGALDKRLGAGVAVLLRKEHVDGAMWEEFIARHLPINDAPCECFVEASSRDQIYDILKDRAFRGGYADRPVTRAVSVGDRVLSVTRFPLRDYRGDVDPAREPVGSVVVWTDRTETILAFKESQVFNVIYAVFAFLLVEGVLWAGMRYGEGRLRRLLEQRNDELRAAATRNRAILDAAAEGIAGLDAQGRTVFVNRAAVEMLGWAEDEIVGQSQHALIHHSHPDGTAYEDRYCPVARTVWDGKVRHVTGEAFWRKDGTHFAVDYTVSPLTGAGGRAEGAVIVFRDDTERLQTRREIADKTSALETSNKELEQFASIISHDLQAPLRMVVSYLGLIEKRLGGDAAPETREFLGYATEGGRRMSRMIKDLLAYSRVGRGGGGLAPVDLAEVCATVAEDLAPMAEDAAARIQVVEPLPPVMGRHDDLVRLLENLVGNAIKYRSPERTPHVRIAARPWEGMVRIDVDDNGPGIPEDQRERVFSFFHRIGRAPGEDGSGIGLAVARKIAGQHGGRIWVEQNPAGQGTRFSLTLQPARE